MAKDDGRSPSGRAVAPSASSPQAVSPVPASIPCAAEGEGIWFLPRCSISRRWEGDLDALLYDHAYRTYAECNSWGLSNWSALITFGVYYTDVYRFDENAAEPFNAIMGDMLGVGRIAVIGGRVWEKEFPELAQATEARRAETGTGSVHESAVGSADAAIPVHTPSSKDTPHDG